MELREEMAQWLCIHFDGHSWNSGEENRKLYRKDAKKLLSLIRAKVEKIEEEIDDNDDYTEGKYRGYKKALQAIREVLK